MTTTTTIMHTASTATTRLTSTGTKGMDTTTITTMT
jgi:hypothetical protein